MSNLRKDPHPSRTAVIVVHGMGSQRPTDTTRHLVQAAWIEDDPDPKPNERDESKANRKTFWVHPERTGDLDLLVFTSSNLFPADSGQKRTFHFHEFYWAHLMSGTKPVAVLLWLFELARRGPPPSPQLKLVWWGGAIFLAALVLSLSFLALHLIEGISEIVETERYVMIFSPLLLIALALGFAILVASYKGSRRFVTLAARMLIRGIAPIGAFVLAIWLTQALHYPTIRSLSVLGWLEPCLQTQPYMLKEAVSTLVALVLPLLIGLVAARILMRCLWPLLLVYVGSWIGFGLYFLYHFGARGSDAAIGLFCRQDVPWSLDSPWSAITAWTILGIYLLLNAAFLQPYLGDAARYFRVSPANIAGQREIRRDAVQLLEELHLSGNYDRIIVVAHSLGTVIAYDMLRAYFSRICGGLPATAKELNENIAAIERDPPPEPEELRSRGRKMVRTMAQLASEGAAKVQSEEEKRAEWSKAWLVTDFITLGSPLCHAIYLTSQGDEVRSVRESGFGDPENLKREFEQRISERQYPTCPPQQYKDDGRLTFLHTRTNTRRFHHGALFGFTRWTNLYFPVSEVLWGDAVGGEIADIFGRGVIDVKVYTSDPPTDELFAHVRYWILGAGGRRNLPHIRLLKRAINLEDKPAITRQEAVDARHEADRVEAASATDTSEAPPSSVDG